MNIFWYIYNFHHFFFRRFSVFYNFDNIFISFYPNIMIFGTFWRGFKILPKTGLNQSLIGPKTTVFIGLLRSWSFPVFRFSGLLWSSPGPVSVFCRSQDWTSKHYSQGFLPIPPGMKNIPRKSCSFPGIPTYSQGFLLIPPGMKNIPRNSRSFSQIPTYSQGFLLIPPGMKAYYDIRAFLSST